MLREMLIMTSYKYIADISKNELDDSIVIPCINELGHRTLLIKNATQKRHSSIYSTKYLIIKRNSVLTYSSIDYYFHVISCKDSSDYINRNFEIIYDYLFRKIDAPIDEVKFSELIMSIEELFSRSNDNLENLQIGLIGELLTLKLLYENGVRTILDKYHKDNYSRHDIEVNNRLKIEVKTTIKEKRIHRFSHSQLDKISMDVYISSVLLIKVESGMTLYRLFEEILKLIDDFEVSFLIKKQMSFCGVDSINQGISFSYEESIKRVKFFPIKEIPKLSGSIPDGISNISYDVQCDFISDMNICEVIRRILSQKSE